MKTGGLSRLGLKLFALLAAVSIVSIGATAWYFSRQLESGFVGYLNAVQDDRLDSLAQSVASHYRQNGNLDGLRGEGLRRLLGQAARGARGEGPPAEAPPFDARPPREGRPPFGARPPQDDRPPFADRPPPRELREPPGPPAGARDLIALGPRLGLEAADGTLVAGRRPPADARATTRDVRVDGALVARLVVAPLPHPEDARDMQFLRVQRQSIALAATAGIVLSLLLAFFVARLWVKRLRDVEQAAARIADGDREGRIDDDDPDEIGALARSVNRMAGSISRLERSRRRWLADIAHELRTPLTVLRGHLEALLDGVRPTTPEALRALEEEVRHLTRLTDDLHQLALADLDALPATRRPVDAAAVARRAVERWQPEAARVGLALTAAGTERAELSADEDRLVQLCDNLLGNSLRYTDAPGSVRLTVERDAREVRLVVDDSPPAVPAEARAGLFEPFFRPDAARSRAKGGSGLGLALSRAIAELHGGRIDAGDSPLGGLRVVARFPVGAA